MPQRIYRPPRRFNIWDEYREWLLWRVGFEKDGYNMLMKNLHDTEFTWIIDRDKNRAQDGMILREEFFEDFGRIERIDEPCSVLEMLVGLSIRVDNEYLGDPNDPHPEIIFFEMIKNLELYVYKDKYFDEGRVENILNKWLNREFWPNGRGSIFPIKVTQNDMRNVEIWTQLQEYLDENY